MRIAWGLWITALAFIATFTVNVIVCLHCIGWYADMAMPPDGVEPPVFDWRDVAIVMALFAASHLVPRLLPARRTRRRLAVDLGEDATYRSAPTRTFVVLNAGELRAVDDARRLVGLAWSPAFALSIAYFGFATQSHSFHGPRQHPAEWVAYLIACVIAVATHVPLRRSSLSRGRPCTPA